MNISKSIRVGLAQDGKKMKDLAQHCQVTQSYLSAMANGKVNLPQTRIQQFADFFNLPVSEFIKLGE